jgi:hypothetical protein
MGDAVCSELHRIEQHLVLLDHAADAGDLGDAGHGLQLVAQEPVLQSAKLRQVVATGAVDQGIFIDPTDAGCVRPKRTASARRQAALHLAEIFEHAAARPIEVGAVLEDHIDEAVAEEGIAAHRLGTGHREHGGGQRISNLVLDDLRRLAGVAGADHDLYVGEIGQRVDRGRAHGP